MGEAAGAGGWSRGGWQGGSALCQEGSWQGWGCKRLIKGPSPPPHMSQPALWPPWALPVTPARLFSLKLREACAGFRLGRVGAGRGGRWGLSTGLEGPGKSLTCPLPLQATCPASVGVSPLQPASQLPPPLFSMGVGEEGGCGAHPGRHLLATIQCEASVKVPGRLKVALGRPGQVWAQP